MFKHRGKEKIKVAFDFVIEKAFNLDAGLNGSTVYISWRRGSNTKSGMTKRALVSKNEAYWNEPFTFSSTFFRDSRDKYDEKSITLELKEDKLKKNTKTIGKISLDLSQYVKSDGAEKIVLPLVKKAKNSPSIMLTIKSHWLKFNNKILIRADDSTERDDQDVVEIEGQDYILHTDSNASETTIDTMSVVSELEDRDHLDGNQIHYHGNNNNHLDGHSYEQHDLEAHFQELDNERLQTIQAQEKELEFLRQQLVQLKQENNENVKKNTSLQQERDDFMNQVEVLKQDNKVDPSAKRSQEKLKERLEKLKHENAEKEKAIISLEEELFKVKQKLDLFKADKDTSDIRIQLENLQQQLEEKDALLAKHEHEIKHLKRKLKNLEHTQDSDTDLRANNKVSPSQEPQTVEHNQTRSKDHEELEQLRLQYEEKLMVEKNIYCAEIGYSNNTSNTASVIFRTLLSWKAFQTPRTALLNDIIQAFNVTVKRSQHDKHQLGYWFSTLISLLYKFQKEKSNFHSTTKGQVHHKESSEAIAQFENGLTNLASDTYKQFLQIVYKELGSLIVSATLEQCPSTVHKKKPLTENAGFGRAKMFDVLKVLSDIFELLQNNHIPETTCSQTFSQLCYYIDAVLFNELCSRRELCSVNNGFQIKMELCQLENWLADRGPSYYKAKDELNHIIEAANLLVMDKSTLDRDLLEHVCPDLNVLQIKTILEIFTPEQGSPEAPAHIIQKLNEMYLKQKTTTNANPNAPSPTLKIDADFVYNLNLTYLAHETPKPKK